MQIDQILIKPILTEKATKLARNKVYMFEVNRKVNKFQIKEAIEKLYPVRVNEVKIVVRKGKERKVGRKMSIKRLPDMKIAYIKLKEGKIDVFPQA